MRRPSYSQSESNVGCDVRLCDNMWAHPKLRVAVLVLMALAGVAIVVGLIRGSLKEPPSQRVLPKVESKPQPLDVAYGTVTGPDGRAIPKTDVHLVIVNADGKEISRHQIPISNGIFKITSDAVPRIANIAAGMVIAQADSYLTRKANVTITAGTSGTTIHPNRIALVLQPYNSALVFILLIPAVFGLVLALLHLTARSRTLAVTQTYAIGAGALWGFIILWLLGLYAIQRGRAAVIPLFWEDLFISSGVVIFAFVGSMVYVAYSMHEKSADFFELPPEKQRPVLLTLGGRVLVAPYVAVAAYGIMAATFPTLNTGAAAAFFGFFTGLWIKPVLEALNDIGLRLLSAEARQKVLDRLLDQNADVEPPPTASAEKVRIEKAFVDAVNAARAELLGREGVIGVSRGGKLTGGLPAGQSAIVVWVYEKKELAENDPNAVPRTIRGIPTDVREVPPPPEDDEHCHDVMLDVSFEKIHRDHVRSDPAAADLASAGSAGLETVGSVLIAVDPSRTLFFRPVADSAGHFFDVVLAYRQVHGTLAGQVDFITFVLESASFSDGNYSVAVRNDAFGIQFHADPKRLDPSSASRYDVRSLFQNDSQLRSVQVLPSRQTESAAPFKMRTFLHEIGHQWCAYLDSPPEVFTRSPLDDQKKHWSPFFDYGDSCVNEAFQLWSSTDVGIKVPEDDNFGYSALDLYLMGVLGKEQLPDFRFFDRAPDASGRHKSFVLPRAQVLAAIGERRPPPPATPPVTFRQAFVVVTADIDRGTRLAKRIDDFRSTVEARFARATTFPKNNGSPRAVLVTSRA